MARCCGNRPNFHKKYGKQSVWLTSELFEFTPVVDKATGEITGYQLHIGSKKYPIGVVAFKAHKTSHTLAVDPRYKLYVFEALKVKHMTKKAKPKQDEQGRGGRLRTGSSNAANACGETEVSRLTGNTLALWSLTQDTPLERLQVFSGGRLHWHTFAVILQR